MFLRKVELFRLQQGHSMGLELLRFVTSFAKAWWKLWHSENGLWGCGNRLWLANCHPPRKGHTLVGKVGGFFYLWQECSKEEEHLVGMESFIKWGGSFGICKSVVASLPSFDSHRSPSSVAQRYITYVLIASS